MFLRIQQGRLRGRRVPVPPEIKKQAHFTPSLIKEAAFQIIENRCVLAETVFFDLFAGSGQMGFEALSRGFGSVVLGEIDSGRIGILRATATELGAGEGGDSGLIIQRKDFRRMGAQVLKEQRAAIFFDPPYSFWKESECPPLSEFLENFIQLRRKTAEENGAGDLAGNLPGDYLIVLQGPAALALPEEPGWPVPEIKKHGRHFLTIIHIQAPG